VKIEDVNRGAFVNLALSGEMNSQQNKLNDENF